MKPKAAASVPDLAVVGQTAKDDEREAKSLLDAARSVEIADHLAYEATARYVGDLKAAREEVDARRRSWVDPLNGVVRSINNAFRPALTAFESAERALRDKLAEYTLRRAEEHEAAVRAISAAPTQAAREEAHAALSEAVVPRVEGLAMVESWDGEVVDASKIPREYLAPDVRKLLEATRAAGGDPKIPGWRAVKKVAPRVTLPGKRGA